MPARPAGHERGCKRLQRCLRGRCLTLSGFGVVCSCCVCQAGQDTCVAIPTARLLCSRCSLVHSLCGWRPRRAVWCTTACVCQVGDFGLATPMTPGGSHVSGYHVGTPFYVAPEGKGEPPCARCWQQGPGRASQLPCNLLQGRLRLASPVKQPHPERACCHRLACNLHSPHPNPAVVVSAVQKSPLPFGALTSAVPCPTVLPVAPKRRTTTSLQKSH